MNAVAALSGHSNSLKIGEPASLGLVVGMADVIACNWPFAADFTFFCHGKTPYNEKRTYDLCENGLYTCSNNIRQAFSKIGASSLVLTLMDDYGTQCCLVMYLEALHFFRRALFEYFFPLEKYEKE
jgi:hypothetical protein